MARGLQELIFPVALAFFIYSYQIENSDVTYTYVLKILKFLKRMKPATRMVESGLSK